VLPDVQVRRVVASPRRPEVGDGQVIVWKDESTGKVYLLTRINEKTYRVELAEVP